MEKHSTGSPEPRLCVRLRNYLRLDKVTTPSPDGGGRGLCSPGAAAAAGAAGLGGGHQSRSRPPETPRARAQRLGAETAGPAVPDSDFIAKPLSGPGGSSGVGPWVGGCPAELKMRAGSALCFSSVFYICLLVFFPLRCAVSRVCFLLPIEVSGAGRSRGVLPSLPGGSGSHTPHPPPPLFGAAPARRLDRLVCI